MSRKNGQPASQNNGQTSSQTRVSRSTNTDWIIVDPILLQSNEDSKPKRKTYKRRQPSVEDDEIQANADMISDMNIEEDEQSWIEKYAPKSSDELAVNSTKVIEVRNWLNEVYDGTVPSMALFVGSTGSCKTATLKVLSKELGIEITEFQDVVKSHDRLYENSSTDRDFDNSQLAQFKKFLTSAYLYRKSLVHTDFTKKLLLVEEFPHGFVMDPRHYHDVILQARKNRKDILPMVFIVSTSTNQSVNLEYKLFPIQIQEKLNMKQIKFNAIAPTFMTKALKRIDFSSRISKYDFDDLIEKSSGDIRNAFNNLEVMYRHERTQISASARNAKKAKTNMLDSDLKASRKDCSPGLFHALGKICYSKRIKMPGNPNRSSLLEDPTKIIADLGINGDRLHSHLSQNYIKFVDEFDEAVNCASWLSTADCIGNGDYSSKKEYWSDYQSELSARGLMHSLPPSSYVEVDEAGKEKSVAKKPKPTGIIMGDDFSGMLNPRSISYNARQKSGFFKFEKLSYYNVRAQASQLAERCRAESHRFLKLGYNYKELVADILPYVTSMSTYKKHTNGFSSDLCREATISSSQFSFDHKRRRNSQNFPTFRPLSRTTQHQSENNDQPTTVEDSISINALDDKYQTSCTDVRFEDETEQTDDNDDHMEGDDFFTITDRLH